MSHRVILIPGDGIGPEVTSAARRVIDATGGAINWQEFKAGGDLIDRLGTALPQATLDAVMDAGLALKGPIATPIGRGHRSVNVEMRRRLDLFANFRPTKSLPGIQSRYEGVDLIVVRENTEGLYSGLEHVVVPGVVESLRVITESASERIVRYAFDTALRLQRKKVTAVHKANILKLSDGLFLDVARRVARDYDDIAFDESIVDATAMKLMMDPSQFDVLVMENLFGDILSDLTSGLVGGLGLAPSANIGDKYAVFEAAHGSAPDIAGKGLANPTALIFSGVLLLRHLGEDAAAGRISAAVRKVLASGKVLTGDLGGDAGTEAYTDAVIAAL